MFFMCNNPNFEMLRPLGSFFGLGGSLFLQGGRFQAERGSEFSQRGSRLFLPINTQNRPLCYPKYTPLKHRSAGFREETCASLFSPDQPILVNIFTQIIPNFLPILRNSFALSLCVPYSPIFVSTKYL